MGDFPCYGWAFGCGVGLLRKVVIWPVEGVAALFTVRHITLPECDKIFADMLLCEKYRRIGAIPNVISSEDQAAYVGEPFIVMPARFSEQKDPVTLPRTAAPVMLTPF